MTQGHFEKMHYEVHTELRYDPITFIPKRIYSIAISPEDCQDRAAAEGTEKALENTIEEMKALLEKMIREN